MTYLVRAYRLRAIADPITASASTGRRGNKTAKQSDVGPDFDWHLALKQALRARHDYQLFIDAQMNCSLMHKPIVMA